MANATAHVAPARVDRVTVELSRTEALTLWHLLRRVGESPNKAYGDTTAKLHTDAVRDAISRAFAGDVSWSQMDSTEVFGGKTTVRSDSLKYIDPHEKPAPPF